MTSFYETKEAEWTGLHLESNYTPLQWLTKMCESGRQNMELAVGIFVWDHSNQGATQKDYLAPCCILSMGSLKRDYRTGRGGKEHALS